MSDPKPKRVMTEEALQKLAKAREIALQVRRQNKSEKLKAEVRRLEQSSSDVTEEPNIMSEPEPSTEVVDTGAKEIKEVKPKKKRMTKPEDPIIVVEQSSDDDDFFEAPSGVLFVKRRRAKPKVEPPTVAPIPQKTQHELDVDYAYTRMVTGSFQMR